MDGTVRSASPCRYSPEKDRRRPQNAVARVQRVLIEVPRRQVVPGEIVGDEHAASQQRTEERRQQRGTAGDDDPREPPAWLAEAGFRDSGRGPGHRTGFRKARISSARRMCRVASSVSRSRWTATMDSWGSAEGNAPLYESGAQLRDARHSVLPPTTASMPDAVRSMCTCSGAASTALWYGGYRSSSRLGATMMRSCERNVRR